MHGFVSMPNHSISQLVAQAWRCSGGVRSAARTMAGLEGIGIPEPFADPDSAVVQSQLTDDHLLNQFAQEFLDERAHMMLQGASPDLREQALRITLHRFNSKTCRDPSWYVLGILRLRMERSSPYCPLPRHPSSTAMPLRQQKGEMRVATPEGSSPSLPEHQLSVESLAGATAAGRSSAASSPVHHLPGRGFLSEAAAGHGDQERGGPSETSSDAGGVAGSRLHRALQRLDAVRRRLSISQLWLWPR